MAKVYEAIDDRMAAWLEQQPVFFVASAPLAADGHLNLSPKGMSGTFRVLGPRRVAYLDFSGSGTETIAHLRENGRIVLMFCSFDERASIVRLHGRGRAVLATDPEFDEHRALFAKHETKGQRSVVLVDVHRVADACGFAVPLMQPVAERDLLDRAHGRRDDDYFPDYWRRRNAQSIDGLPAVT